MELKIKRFCELSADELYEIYKLRVAVFVVEQNCPYQEVDKHDRAAVHVWFEENGEMIAYLRVLPRGTVYENVSIGRVISVRRREGIGLKIVKEGIEIAKREFGAEKIEIEAQTYAKALYEKAGFVQASDEFIEDGIPHVKMELEI